MAEISLSILDRITDVSQTIFQETLQNPNIRKIGEFTTAGAVEYVVRYLKERKPDSQSMVCQFLGSPGSGKSTLTQLTNTALTNSVALSTNDYNIGTREDRRRIIVQGGTPLDENDFALLASHVDALRHLSTAENLYLPEPYDPNTGHALIKGLARKIVGPINYVLIDGNFYIGNEGVSNVPLDSLIYLHMSDRNRLYVRLIRDLTEGQMRSKNAEDVLSQFQSRRESQDKLFTLPFMNKANLIIKTEPQFLGQKIEDFTYTIYRHSVYSYSTL